MSGRVRKRQIDGVSSGQRLRLTRSVVQEPRAEAGEEEEEQQQQQQRPPRSALNRSASTAAAAAAPAPAPLTHQTPKPSYGMMKVAAVQIGGFATSRGRTLARLQGELAGLRKRPLPAGVLELSPAVGPAPTEWLLEGEGACACGACGEPARPGAALSPPSAEAWCVEATVVGGAAAYAAPLRLRVVAGELYPHGTVLMFCGVVHHALLDELGRVVPMAVLAYGGGGGGGGATTTAARSTCAARSRLPSRCPRESVVAIPVADVDMMA